MSQGVGDWGAHLAAPTAHRGERAPNVPPGESVDDCGGGYSESIAEICEELQNGLTPLLIVTPNGRDESGANRDCYLFSPAARAPVHTNMFRFLGARGMGHRGWGARVPCAPLAGLSPELQGRARAQCLAGPRRFAATTGELSSLWLAADTEVCTSQKLGRWKQKERGLRTGQAS